MDADPEPRGEAMGTARPRVRRSVAERKRVDKHKFVTYLPGVSVVSVGWGRSLMRRYGRACGDRFVRAIGSSMGFVVDRFVLDNPTAERSIGAELRPLG